jgi:uncharacterized membrane protein YdjX (TVP38/TMEM64 family)
VLAVVLVVGVHHWIDSIGGPTAVRERFGAKGLAVSFVAHWVLNLTPLGGAVPTAAANGAIWGFWLGALVSWSAWVAASLTQYLVVRWVASELDVSQGLARLPERIRRLPIGHPLFQVGGRSLPWVGLHVVSVSSALAGVPLGRFLVYAALGQAGPAFAMAALGSGLVSLSRG